MTHTLRSATRLLLGAWLCAAAAGCAAAPTHVEQGKPYSTGNGDIDQFFSGLDELRSDVEHGESDVVDMRARLAKALGLHADADTDAIVDAAMQKARGLRDGGTLLHLYLTPEPKVLAAGEKPPPAEDDQLLKDLEKITRDSLTLCFHLSDVQRRAGQLEKDRQDLGDRVASLGDKKAEAKRELSAAEKAIHDAGERAARQSGAIAKLAIDLARALETGGAAAEVKPDKKRPAGKPGPAPPKKPKSSDDFEP